MANDSLVRVRVVADGVAILQTVEPFVDSSRLCRRCRHRGLLSASSTVSGLLLTKLRAKV